MEGLLWERDQELEREQLTFFFWGGNILDMFNSCLTLRHISLFVMIFPISICAALFQARK